MSYLFDELSDKKDKSTPVEDKILLMGLQAAGKTAIKDVVFFNKQPGEVDDYMATVHYQRQFIDEEQKSMIIDSGGQESYWNEAVTQFRHLVFSNVKLLVWIVDVTKPELFEESERRFSFTIRQYKKENPEGKITVLCHKVDLVTPEKMIVIHQHVREMLSDERFEIDFENTSIYFRDSLRELMFTIMEEAGINTKRFELISNLGQKVEESQEFQSYVMEHAEDERVKQLRDYLNPEPEALLPSFGKLNIQFDLKEYDIVEIVLIDKETNSPLVGASSHATVSSENSMEYLIGLHDFKTTLKENGGTIDPAGTVLTSSTGKVHAMVFNLDANYLMITSFSPISDERKALLYTLILKFAESTASAAAPDVKATKEAKIEPLVEPKPVTAPIPEKVEVAEDIPVDVSEPLVAEEAVPDAKPIEISEILTEEEKAAGFFEPAVIDDKFLAKAEAASEEVVEELVAKVEGSVTEDMPEIVEEPPVAVVESDEVPEPPVVEILEEPVQPVSEEVPVVADNELKGKFADIVGEREVSIEETPAIVTPPVPEPAKVVEEVVAQPTPDPVVEESITPPEPIVEEVIETPTPEPVSTEIDPADAAISFSADDIKNFASFLVQKKETILDEKVSVDDIKSMSNFLFKGITEEEEAKAEAKEEVE